MCWRRPTRACVKDALQREPQFLNTEWLQQHWDIWSGPIGHLGGTCHDHNRNLSVRKDLHHGEAALATQPYVDQGAIQHLSGGSGDGIGQIAGGADHREPKLTEIIHQRRGYDQIVFDDKNTMSRRHVSCQPRSMCQTA